jgi:hypothetical protein
MRLAWPRDSFWIESVGIGTIYSSDRLARSVRLASIVAPISASVRAAVSCSCSYLARCFAPTILACCVRSRHTARVTCRRILSWSCSSARLTRAIRSRQSLDMTSTGYHGSARRDGHVLASHLRNMADDNDDLHALIIEVRKARIRLRGVIEQVKQAEAGRRKGIAERMEALRHTLRRAETIHRHARILRNRRGSIH